MTGPDLVHEVKPFLASSGMAPSMFCKAALGDPAAWRRWTEGCSVTDKTVARVRAYITARADQQRLLVNIAALPAGERLPLSRFAREGNCTTSIIVDQITALIEAGAIDRETLRPPIGGCADRAGNRAEPESGPAAAPDGPLAAGGGSPPPAVTGQKSVTADCPRQPTGAELADELRAAAAALKVPLQAFLAPLHGAMSPTGYLRQLSFAKRPKPATVDRVRALIAGRNPDPLLPPHGLDRRNPDCGNAIMRDRALAVATEERARDDLNRRAAELGRALRQPGETLAEAVRRESTDLGERRRNARKLSATVHDPLPISEFVDLRKISPSYPKARKYEPLPPDTWAALKRLADETGEAPMALLPIVVERGIESFRRSA